MRLHSLKSEIWLPRGRDEVFQFFSRAENLEFLTPPWLSFRVLTPTPVIMQKGTRIDYKLRVRGVPMRWQSEITVWEPPARFVDEQRRGPYRRWVHEHLFEEQEGGTTVRDSVEYAVWGGALVNRFLVAPDLRRIFAYREERLGKLFARGS